MIYYIVADCGKLSVRVSTVLKVLARFSIYQLLFEKIGREVRHAMEGKI